MGDMAELYDGEWDDNDLRMEKIPVFEFVRETEKAYLVKLKEGEKITEHWFPKSVCMISDTKKSIEVPPWLLDAKGIS